MASRPALRSLPAMQLTRTPLVSRGKSLLFICGVSGKRTVGSDQKLDRLTFGMVCMHCVIWGTYACKLLLFRARVTTRAPGGLFSFIRHQIAVLRFSVALQLV